MRTIPALLVAALLFACASGPALAQPMAANAMNPGGAISPTGPLLSTPAAIINVVDSGAKCNTNIANPSSGADDTAAINAAIGLWRAAGANGPATLTFPRNGLACKITAPLNFTQVSTSAQIGQTVDGMNLFASFSPRGPIGTLGTITPGTGGTNGTYTNVPLINGSGSGCVATSVVVSGGGITSITLPSGGCGTAYAKGDTLSVTGNISGFSVTVASISGRAAVDAMGNRFIHWRNVNIYGDCASASTMPNVGMAIGRTSNGTSADDFDFSYPVIGGCFALADFYNLASETLTFDHPDFGNNNTNGGTYELIQDGSNHWNWSSTFQTVTTPVDTFQSFNENTFISANLNGYGSAIWMSGTERHKYIGSYIAATGYAVVLYSTNQTIANIMLNADIHIETTGVTDCFFVTGSNPNPVLVSFSYRDHASDCQNSILKTDTNIVSATAYDFNVEVPFFANALVPQVFGTPSVWSVAGHVYVPSNSNWGAPSFWSGELCTSYCLYSGSIGNVSAGGVSATSLTSPLVDVGALNASTIQNAGSVSAISIGAPTTSPIDYWSTGQLAGSLPTVVLSAANGGGASASLSSIVLGGTPALSGGAGCSVGDTFLLTDPQPGGGIVGGGNVILTVTGVNAGSVTSTSYASSANNAYLWNKPWSYQTAISKISSSCATLPTLPMVGLYANEVWSLSNNGGGTKATINVLSGGAGYSVAPTIGFSPPFQVTSAGGAPITVSLASGVTLGLAGASGQPVTNAGAQIDGTGVRVSLTTAGFAVPANCDLVRFTQSSAVASATVTLPTAFADGQPIQFVNYAGAVTALTFSPAVAGWTNGSTLAANTGLRVRWDAAASAWQREQ